MKSILVFIVCTSMISLCYLPFVFAENLDQSNYGKSNVIIPKEEYIGYIDANGIYTVVGNIKNQESFALIPTLKIVVQDDEKIISKTFEFVTINPSKDQPFKIKLPEVKGNTPILKEPEITFVPTNEIQNNIEVVYDKTLIKHDDGHLTGYVINKGNSTAYNVKVFALIHDFEKVVDLGQNMELIEKLEPGQTASFSMYPDPSITSKINYYSCFVPSETSVVPVYTERNGKNFYFRYDAGTWYYDAHFNDKGTELTMKTQTSFSLPTYANFEFPMFSENEKFNVVVNGESKKIIQSRDDRGNWHVAFNVEPFETGIIKISGFKQGWDPGDRIFIPDWIKNTAGWWAQGKIDDTTFVKGIEFMIKENIIKIPIPDKTETSDKAIPDWFKSNAKWWYEENLTDETFLKGLEYLLKRGIIQI